MRSEVFLDLLKRETAVSAYLDLTNMFHWQEILRWKFRIEDVIAQLAAVSSMKEVRIYYGFNQRDEANSRRFHKRIRATGAILIQKPVKWIRRTIHESMFFKQATLAAFTEDTFLEVNKLVNYFRQSGLVIEEPKCNFDVEMTMDLLDATEKHSALVLFSGDSDLRAPLERLKIKGRRVYVCCVRGKISRELVEVSNGLIDFGAWYKGKRI